jgi:hypothetical protein
MSGCPRPDSLNNAERKSLLAIAREWQEGRTTPLCGQRKSRPQGSAWDYLARGLLRCSEPGGSFRRFRAWAKNSRATTALCSNESLDA